MYYFLNFSENCIFLFPAQQKRVLRELRSTPSKFEVQYTNINEYACKRECQDTWIYIKLKGCVVLIFNGLEGYIQAMV